MATECSIHKKSFALREWQPGGRENIYIPIDLVGSVFANGPGVPGFNCRSSHIKDSKNVT